MAIFPLTARPHLHGAIDEVEQHRLELIIATARAFLAGISLLAISLDPSAASQYSGLVYKLLVAYDIHSAAVLLLFRFGPIRAARLGLLLHMIDVAWAVAITFMTEGPSSSYFALFVFVLLSAAYRWGFRETLFTGLVAVGLFFSEAVAAAEGFVVARLALSTLVMRSAYFLLATFLLAFLSEQAKALRAVAIVVSRMTDKVNVQGGLAASLRAVLDDLMKLFGSRHALLALEDLESGRMVLWEARLEGASPVTNIKVTDLEASQRNHYFFPLPPDISAWESIRTSTPGAPRLTWQALNKDGHRVRRVHLEIPAVLTGGHWKTVLGLTLGFSNDWIGRLFLVNPTARPAGERRLRFLQAVMGHVGPVLHNVYLLRRLRSRIGVIERARVARELHDSVIQALIGLEMQLDVLRRQSSVPPQHAERLTSIQNMLRDEIQNVRDLMEQLRPKPADLEGLVQKLTDLTDRFRRDTGIDARFIAEVGGADLPGRLCHELTRIVQEGLTNVRKHSGASSARVHLHVDDWAWKITITDDGRGFGIVGAFSHAELAGRRLGPRTIRERAEAVGAKLLVRSGPDGAGLEIVGRIKRPWIVTPGA